MGIRLEEQELQRLLGSGSGDACLLYLYIKSHGALVLSEAARTLQMDDRRLEQALTLLSGLGLVAAPTATQPPAPEAHRYTEQDVVRAQREDQNFSLLVGEAQRRLGRPLSGEELKTLLGLRDFLRLPTEVIGLLIHYCIQRSRSRGSGRMPSMRVIEKEGYAWAEQEINTVEAAAQYMNRQLKHQEAVRRYQELLGYQDRRLSAGEERYLLQWAQLDLPDEVIALAYDRTCLSASGMKWPYMDAILRSWAEQNLRTVEQIRQMDKKPQSGKPTYTRGKSAQPPPGDLRQPVELELGEAERRAIDRLRQQNQKEG